jgi:hypothetical protein
VLRGIVAEELLDYGAGQIIAIEQELSGAVSPREQNVVLVETIWQDANGLTDLLE